MEWLWWQNEENKLIHKDVKEPLQTLVKAAAKDKVALYPSSIFRSVRLQDTIIKRKIRQNNRPRPSITRHRLQATLSITQAMRWILRRLMPNSPKARVING